MEKITKVKFLLIILLMATVPSARINAQIKGSIPDEAVDLGLPSGTKWAPWNVGASKPEEYGGYYAWGETEVKLVYDWSTYIHCDGSYDTCHDIFDWSWGISGTEYDVAHVKWGGMWKMPYLSHFQELVDNCTFELTTINDVEGCKFTGPNGNSIFLPAACTRDNVYSTRDSKGRRFGAYWSQQCAGGNWDFNAWDFVFNYDGERGTSGILRSKGLCVRPVIAPFPLRLNKDIVTLHEGETSQVKISGNGSYTIASDKPSVATAILSRGIITISAVSLGTATITVTDTMSGQTATLEVTVTEPTVDLGLPSGTLWADRNLGASSPEDYGGYYAWGETEEKAVYDRSTYTHGDGSVCQDLGKDIALTEYDVAHVKYGGSWQMPTQVQVKELLENCTSEWTTVNGVEGCKFKGPNGNSIFLPAAGDRWGKSFDACGSVGSYWSSASNYDDFAYLMRFGSGYAEWRRDYRVRGCSVRPVITTVLTLSDDEISLDVGGVAHVRIYGGSGSYSITASNNNVIVSLAENMISIQGNAGGESEVIVADDNTDEKKTITITVKEALCPDANHPHMLDLGLPSGTKWACCNVGASKPEGDGAHYAWGETEEKESYDWDTYTHNDEDLESDIAGTDYDVAHVKWGGLWRMPTDDQWTELQTNCSAEWTTFNGIDGLKLTGNNDNSIFLPAVGIRQDDNPGNRNSGDYWSSKRDGNWPEHAIAFTFGATKNAIVLAVDHLGLSVRPVFLEVPDGIETTDKDQLTVDVADIYNLSGQRIAKPQRGVYIIDGKKVIVK